jgi:hypothetical protein
VQEPFSSDKGDNLRGHLGNKGHAWGTKGTLLLKILPMNWRSLPHPAHEQNHCCKHQQDCITGSDRLKGKTTEYLQTDGKKQWLASASSHLPKRENIHQGVGVGIGVGIDVFPLLSHVTSKSVPFLRSLVAASLTTLRPERLTILILLYGMLPIGIHLFCN